MTNGGMAGDFDTKHLNGRLNTLTKLIGTRIDFDLVAGVDEGRFRKMAASAFRAGRFHNLAEDSFAGSLR